jgi:hypothetical protein
VLAITVEVQSQRQRRDFERQGRNRIYPSMSSTRTGYVIVAVAVMIKSFQNSTDCRPKHFKAVVLGRLRHDGGLSIVGESRPQLHQTVSYSYFPSEKGHEANNATSTTVLAVRSVHRFPDIRPH